MNWYYGIVLTAFVGLFAGCAVTKQARNVETSGFLGDIYSKMWEGKKGEALLVYRSPKVKQPGFIKSYKKILLDPVMVWRGKETQKEGVDKAELQLVADTFYSLIYQELSMDYEMVNKPGPNTARAQIAITKAQESTVTLDVISSVIAPMNFLRLSSRLKDLGTGKPLFVGEARIESKATDALTGELLAAWVDDRVGTMALSASKFDSWGTVHKALEYWAKQARFRFCRGRGEDHCIPPEN